MDEANDLASGPDAVLGVAVDKDLPAPLATDKGGNLGKLTRLALLLDFERLVCHLVAVQAGGVLPPPEDQCGVSLLGLDDLLLDVVVDGGFYCAHEAGAHL